MGSTTKQLTNNCIKSECLEEGSSFKSIWSLCNLNVQISVMFSRFCGAISSQKHKILPFPLKTQKSCLKISYLSPLLSPKKAAFQVLKDAGAEIFDFTCLEMRLGQQLIYPPSRMTTLILPFCVTSCMICCGQNNGSSLKLLGKIHNQPL